MEEINKKHTKVEKDSLIGESTPGNMSIKRTIKTNPIWKI